MKYLLTTIIALSISGFAFADDCSKCKKGKKDDVKETLSVTPDECQKGDKCKKGKKDEATLAVTPDECQKGDKCKKGKKEEATLAHCDNCGKKKKHDKKDKEEEEEAELFSAKLLLA